MGSRTAWPHCLEVTWTAGSLLPQHTPLRTPPCTLFHPSPAQAGSCMRLQQCLTLPQRTSLVARLCACSQPASAASLGAVRCAADKLLATRHLPVSRMRSGSTHTVPQMLPRRAPSRHKSQRAQQGRGCRAHASCSCEACRQAGARQQKKRAGQKVVLVNPLNHSGTSARNVADGRTRTCARLRN